MTTREEYLQKLKSQLDQWNADIKVLEAKAEEAQAQAAAEYHKQLDSLRSMRDDATKRYAEIQDATTDAWHEIMKATDRAWDAWIDAFTQARSKISKGDK